MTDLMLWLALVPAVLAMAGLVYETFAARELHRFVHRRRPRTLLTPPLTVMKPLCGDEPCLEANLRSFAEQDYPRVQLVFGVRDRDDPALAAVARLRARYPALDMAVVVDPTLHGSNLKVSNLVNMMAEARHDVLVVADSDVRVGADYLRTLVAGLGRPGVGLVTCLYTGRAPEGVWSRLFAMGMNHRFVPSALAARALGRADGCFGPTMALRRETLESAGGFRRLANRLADDYDLGALVRAQGLTVALAPLLIDVVAHQPGLAALFRHELRWERTVAVVAPLAHAASVVAQPVPLALLAALASPWALPLLALAVAVRLWAVRRHERLLALAPAPPALVLGRDLLSFAVYACALGGRSVVWRGNRFRVRRDGTLLDPLEEAART